MGIKKVVKKGLSMGFQPKRWLGLDHVKSNGKLCSDLVHDLLAKKKSPEQLKQEAEEKRLEQKMTKAELQSRKKIALSLTVFYGLLSIGLLIYAVYLWFSKTLILPGCMSFIVSLLVLVYGLREFIVFGQIHFDYRRLSLSKLIHLFINGKERP